MEERIFKKHIECGIYSFDVAIDRDIATRAMEAYPSLCEYVFTQAKEGAKKAIAARKSNKKVEQPDEVDILIENVKAGKMSEMIEQDKVLAECVKFAFPLMLKKAGSDLNANVLIQYIYDNGVSEDFNAGMYELILMGFTQREVAEKKVNFSMK